MTATLVLGGPRSGKSRHAQALLAHHPQVTLVETHLLAAQAAAPGDDAEVDPDSTPVASLARRPDFIPEHWRTLETLDLTRALLASRHPVLIDDLSGWLQGVLAAESLLSDPERARQVVEERLDELSVALRAMPFDVVTVSHDPSWVRLPQDPTECLYIELLAHVNQRVSAASGRVFAIMAGRVVDLSNAPVLGAV